MKPWQCKAIPLPFTIRPLAGETLISFTWRLATANELRKTAVLRAIGQIGPSGSGYHLYNWDVALNEPALERLEILSDIPRERLRRALPSLTRRWPHFDLPEDHPVVRTYSSFSRYVATPCPQCTLRRQAVEALVYLSQTRHCCLRHRWWLAGPQLDMNRAPETVTAYRRYLRFLGHGEADDQALAHDAFRDAARITAAWSRQPTLHPVLAERWQLRAKALGTEDWHLAVRLPESLILARVLTDPAWRRHVAMVHEYQQDPFYQRIDQALGHTNPKRGTWRWHRDPIQDWIRQHRANFAQVREDFYATFPAWSSNVARRFPPLEQFKRPPQRS